MICFDGTYRFKRPEDAGVRRQRWRNAWRLRIIDLSMGAPGIRQIRPVIVAAVWDGRGHSRYNCAETLGRRICRDFDLAPERVLWLERPCGRPDEVYVADYRPGPKTDGPPVYTIQWRRAAANELAAATPFVPEFAAAAPTAP